MPLMSIGFTEEMQHNVLHDVMMMLRKDVCAFC